LDVILKKDVILKIRCYFENWMSIENKILVGFGQTGLDQHLKILKRLEEGEGEGDLQFLARPGATLKKTINFTV
jgi:hypothetical protein